jgi:hypothetical protein
MAKQPKPISKLKPVVRTETKMRADWRNMKQADEKTLEQRLDDYLGNPQQKARDRADEARFNKKDDPYDNVRHANAGRYTTEAIRNKVESKIGKNPVGKTIGKVAGFVGSNLLGAAHEGSVFISGYNKDKRPLSTKLRESAEDMYNNYVGSKIGLSDNPSKQKTKKILELSYKNQIPDGYGEKDPFNNKVGDLYGKKNKKNGKK